jgi:hypothetical protein
MNVLGRNCSNGVLGRKTQFLRLFNMAMDLLSISAMPRKNDRVLSAAKLTISSQRNALHGVTAEALQCLRKISWAKPRVDRDITLYDDWLLYLDPLYLQVSE